MSFSDQYIETIEKVYELTVSKATKLIENDLSVSEIFGSCSNISLGIFQLDKFGKFELDDLKELVRALIKSHLAYESQTNKSWRTDTLRWIIGTFKIKASVYGIDDNEGLYADYWAAQLFTDPETPYLYNPEFGKKLFAEQERQKEITKKLEAEKAERLRKEENEIELRQMEKQKAYFEHLNRNQKQTELRESFLNNFSKLSLIDKILTITTDTKPLHYYPTDIAGVDIDTLKSLSSEQRTRLFEMIKKYRIKEWYDTKERIQQLDRK